MESSGDNWADKPKQLLNDFSANANNFLNSLPKAEPRKPNFIRDLKENAGQFFNNMKDGIGKLSTIDHSEDVPVDKETRDGSYERVGSLNAKEENTDDHMILAHEQARVETLNMLTNRRFNTANMSLAKRQFWSNEMVSRLEASHISLTKQHILIAAVIIDRESGFNEAKIVPDPEKLVDSVIVKFKNEHGVIYAAAKDDIERGRTRALAFIAERRQANLQRGIYRTTTDGKQIGLFTENDLDVAVDYAMGVYDEEATDLLKKFYAKEDLNKFRPKMRGCMGISVQIAIEMAKKYENKDYSADQMHVMLSDTEISLKYGMFYLKEILETNEKNGALTADQVRFAFVDYNLGPYTTRNAAIQRNIIKLGQHITPTGSLLLYDPATGRLLSDRSETEKAIFDLLDSNGSSIDKDQIRKDLELERTVGFEGTKTYQVLSGLFQKNNLSESNYIPQVQAKNGNVKTLTPKIDALQFADGSYERYAEGDVTYESKAESGQTMIESVGVGTLNKGKIRVELDSAAVAVKELLRLYHELEKDHPQEVADIKIKHPRFAMEIAQISTALDFANQHYGNIDGKSLEGVIDDYNHLARSVNFVVKKLGIEEKEDREMATVDVKFGEVEVDEKELSPEEKDEVRKFAKDVYRTLFPESYTDRFVKWETGQVGGLSTAEKIAAAPMNGIESVGSGIVNFLEGDGPLAPLIPIGEGVYRVGELMISKKDRVALYESGKFLWNNTSAADKIAPAISFVTSFIMLSGGIAKLGSLAKSLGYSEKVVVNIGKACRSFRTISKFEKPLLLSAMAGITLPYLSQTG